MAASEPRRLDCKKVMVRLFAKVNSVNNVPDYFASRTISHFIGGGSNEEKHEENEEKKAKRRRQEKLNID
jgi:hypothetical protein